MTMDLAGFAQGDEGPDADILVRTGIITGNRTGHITRNMTDFVPAAAQEEIEVRRRVIRRRRWSDEEKLRILAEAFATGSNRKAVAERHGIAPAQLYIWRKQLTVFPAGEGFVPVHVDRQLPMASRTEISSALTPVEIVLPNGISIRADAAFDPDMMCRLVHGLRRA
ncbi:IS66-like element accessory protein TnpA [Acetobacter indonesiensis]